MPIAKFKSIREVSSEDAVHSAKNLLAQHSGKKWKTHGSGEQSAYVILELEEPQQITGIDIGNEHSAFVQVLVSNTGCSPDNFVDILLTCSFMTPIESKNSSNSNRVRCFNQDALVSTALAQKWKFVKVFCTQPFNKHVPYGLSFITLHVTEQVTQKSEHTVKSLVPAEYLSGKLLSDTKKGGAAKPSLLHLGKFKMREDSPDSESESTTSLFNRWKMSHNTPDKESPLTTAAAIREASNSSKLRRMSEEGSFKTKVSLKTPTLKASGIEKSGEVEIRDRNRDSLLFGDDDDADTGQNAKTESLVKQIEIERERLRAVTESAKKEKEKPKTSRSTGSGTHSTKDANVKKTPPKIVSPRSETTQTKTPTEGAKKRHSSPSNRPAKRTKPTASTTSYRPFNQLFRGVVVVISGIQNPDRADLRNKALAMGAKYKGDWEPGCTHLICAFKNTPKYNQVKGKGKIVTRSWIEDCFAAKKYLPWRRYAMDSKDLAQPESDVEIFDESLNPDTVAMEVGSDSQNQSEMQKTKLDRSEKSFQYDVDEHEEGNEVYNLTSGSDTEDELERIAQKNTPSIAEKENTSSTVNKVKNQQKSVYDASTEEEDFLKEKLKMSGVPPNFFKKCKFYICDDVGAVARLKLDKFIKQYGGTFTQNLKEAHYAISESGLHTSKDAYFLGETVRPSWVFECNDMEMKIPTTRYLV